MQIEHLAVMQQAIHDRGSQAYVLNDLRPLGQALVRGDDRWSLFVAAGDQLIQCRTEDGRRGQVAEFIEDQDVTGKQRPQDALPPHDGRGPSNLGNVDKFMAEVQQVSPATQAILVDHLQSYAP